MKKTAKVDKFDVMKFFRKNYFVYSKQDLKRFIINPPSSEGQCDCCGRSIDVLKPFEKPRDVFVIDMGGALLVKNFRSYNPHDEEIENIMKIFYGKCKTDADFAKADKKLVQKYGKERADEIKCTHEITNSVSYSWECSDCYYLDAHDFEKIWGLNKSCEG